MTGLKVSEGVSSRDIKNAVELLGSLPQVDLPVKHHFAPGVYVREIFMPAGSRVIGKVHKTRHLNIVISGKITIWTVHGRMDITGPCTFESMGGVQKVLYMHTDCIYMTVHANPDDETRDDIIEERVIMPSEQAELFPELNQFLVGEDK